MTMPGRVIVAVVLGTSLAACNSYRYGSGTATPSPGAAARTAAARMAATRSPVAQMLAPTPAVADSAAAPAGMQWVTLRVDGNGAGDARIVREGQWEAIAQTGDPARRYAVVRSGHATDDVVVRFIGSQIRVYGPRDPDGGTGVVYIDHALTDDHTDNYAPAHSANGLLYTSPSLAYGKHQVSVQVSGVANPASKGDNVELTFVRVLTNAER